MAHQKKNSPVVSTSARECESPIVGRAPDPLRQAPPIPRLPNAAPAQSPLAAPAAKPSKSQSRAAHREAVSGVRLARHGRHAQAIACFKQSVRLDPTVATTHHDLGRACLEAGRFEEAAEGFARAVRLEPALVSAHEHLAVALECTGSREGAYRAYQETVRLDPGRHQAQFRLGRLYLARQRRADALACFQAAAAATAGTVYEQVCQAYAALTTGEGARAEALLREVIAARPDCGEAHLVLGEALAHAGQSCEAAECFERAIALAPTHLSAWQGFATNRRFTAVDRPLLERVRADLERPNLPPAQARALHFALGKAHNDLGDYAEAMGHFEAANRIRAASAPFDRAALMRTTERLIAATSPGFIERAPRLASSEETPLLIIGMPRSGTTLVEQILSSHPDVAAGGELPFWYEHGGAAMEALALPPKAQVLQQLAEQYVALLRLISPAARRVTDKMPFNFCALGLIRVLFPRATIVHCRRHPVDTCLSIFMTDFEAPMSFASERSSLVDYYRQYQRLMSHWVRVLAPQRLIELEYEELVADPEPVTRRLIASCGLTWHEACLSPHLNRRPIHTASVWQARQPIHRDSVARWQRYEPWLGALRELL